MGLARSNIDAEPQAQSVGEDRCGSADQGNCCRMAGLWLSPRHRRIAGWGPHRQPQTGHATDEGKWPFRARPRRRFVVTTDSDHDGPIFTNLARDVAPTGPNQLWVADITFIAIATGFVYLAAILDAWSRRVVGYAIGRRIDARLALAALKAAIASRRPPAGCIHHSDRGSQYAAEDYRAELARHGLRGSMAGRGNPYDNAKAETRSKLAAIRGVPNRGDGHLQIAIKRSRRKPVAT